MTSFGIRWSFPPSDESNALTKFQAACVLHAAQTQSTLQNSYLHSILLKSPFQQPRGAAPPFSLQRHLIAVWVAAAGASVTDPANVAAALCFGGARPDARAGAGAGASANSWIGDWLARFAIGGGGEGAVANADDEAPPPAPPEGAALAT